MDGSGYSQIGPYSIDYTFWKENHDGQNECIIFQMDISLFQMMFTKCIIFKFAADQIF